MWIDDEVIVECSLGLYADSFIPAKAQVVLGAANKEDLEVNLRGASLAEVSITKRYGGGGTVVLYDGCVVARLGCWVKEKFQNDYYFEKINQSLIDVIKQNFSDLPPIEQRGISDLTVGDKKFCGTSMFRSRNYLLFQASLIVDLDLDLINKVLSHPTKEPDYRLGRSHGDFLTGLGLFSKDISPKSLCSALKSGWERAVLQRLEGHSIEPIKDQIPHLLKRAGLPQ